MTSPDSEHGTYRNEAAYWHSPDNPRGSELLPMQGEISPLLYRSETLHLVDNVPMTTMLNDEFCGYASLAMMLQFHGRNLDQYDVFHRVHETDIDPKRVTKDKLPASPSFYGLAAAATKIVGSDLRVDLWREKEYEKWKREYPESTPLSVLDMYLRDFNVPVMVRIPGHNMVAVGVDASSPVFGDKRKIYLFNDPNGGRRRLEDADDFRFLWGNRTPREDLAGRPIAIDRLHPGNTAYLLMAIRKR